MRRNTLVLFASMFLLVSLPPAAPAATDPTAKCAAAKLKAAGKKYASKAKCEAASLVSGDPVSADCLQKADDRFAAAFAKAEADGPCPGQLDELGSGVDTCVGDATTEVTPTTTTTTIPDTDPPGVVSADDLSATSVAVVFDEALDPASVQADGSDFVIDNGVTVASAALQPGGTTVVLQTSALADSTTYTVIVSGVTDLAGNSIAAAENQAQFTRQATTGCGTHLLISEVRSRGLGGGSDEFVEIYNPTGAPIAADSGWRLEFRSTAGGSYVTRWNGGGESIPAGGHLLLASSGYTQSPAADATLTSGITDQASLRLMQGSTIVDAVCYAFSQSGVMTLTTGGMFTCEGTPILNANGGSDVDSSVERKAGGAAGNCQDTDDNASDFQVIAPADPQDLASATTP